MYIVDTIKILILSFLINKIISRAEYCYYYYPQYFPTHPLISLSRHIDPVSMADQRKESIKRSGALLLAGWKMLASTCPVCSNALFSKGDEMRCAYCDLPVRIASANDHVEERSSNIVAGVATSAAEEVKQPEVRSTPVLAAATSTVFDEQELQRRKQLDQASKLLGEKMLQGWTMLAQYCPDFTKCRGTPLMRERNSPFALCVCCNQKYDVTPAGDVLPFGTRPAEGGDQGKPPLSTEIGRPSVDAEVEDDDGDDDALFQDDEPIFDLRKIPRLQEVDGPEDSSMRLSNLMLRGYTLLSETCPIARSCDGNVPLVREPGTGKVSLKKNTVKSWRFVFSFASHFNFIHLIAFTFHVFVCISAENVYRLWLHR